MTAICHGLFAKLYVVNSIEKRNDKYENKLAAGDYNGNVVSKRVTMPQSDEKYEVFNRTNYSDIETIIIAKISVKVSTVHSHYTSE